MPAPILAGSWSVVLRLHDPHADIMATNRPWNNAEFWGIRDLQSPFRVGLLLTLRVKASYNSDRLMGSCT